ncbi:MAG: MFS transporter [Planctomycetota bacterium]
MTTIPATKDHPIEARTPRLWIPIGAHTGVDFLQFITISLLPLLSVRLGITTQEKSLLIGLGIVASGSVQPVVAWLSDRHDSRWLGTAGVVVATVCVALVGFAPNFPVLLTLFLLGSMGVGAFHPPAAATVGTLAGKRRRSVMLNVFFMSGMLGGMVGNALTPQFVRGAGALSGGDEAAQITFGLHALIGLLPLGLLTAMVLGRAIHNTPHRHATAHDDHHALSATEKRRRWGAVWLLYFANVIRFAVNNALIYLFIEWSERLTAARAGVTTLDEQLGLKASATSGPLQAAMQLGMGIGGIGLGALLVSGLGRRLEKLSFIVIPMVGTLVVASFPYADRLESSAAWATLPAAFTIAVLGGIGFGALIPVSLSIAQRLLPHRTGLASGMMLGGAWMFAIVGALVAEAIHADNDANLEHAFLIAAVVLSAASALGLFLPGRLLRETAHD